MKCFLVQSNKCEHKIYRGDSFIKDAWEGVGTILLEKEEGVIKYRNLNFGLKEHFYLNEREMQWQQLEFKFRW